MWLSIDARREHLEQVARKAKAVGVAFRATPRDAWHLAQGRKVQPEDEAWVVLEYEGPLLEERHWKAIEELRRDHLIGGAELPWLVFALEAGEVHAYL